MVMADPSDLGHGKKRVPDGHGRSFGSWPWQKQLDTLTTNAMFEGQHFAIHAMFFFYKVSIGILPRLQCLGKD